MTSSSPAWLDPTLWTQADRKIIKNLNDPDLLDSLRHFDPAVNFDKMTLRQLDGYLRKLQDRMNTQQIRLLVAVLDAVEEQEATNNLTCLAQAALNYK